MPILGGRPCEATRHVLSQHADKQRAAVRRKSDRVISIKLLVGKRMLNFISAYAPQTGCSQEEKEHFYEENGEHIATNPRTGRHMDRSRSK